MELIPAIDLLDGCCVRLMQGDYQRATVFHHDPLIPFEQYLDAGIRRVHIVDLNAARGDTESPNVEPIMRLVERAPGVIQVGGGVRTEAAVDRLLDLGVWRVVVGTVALRQPGRVCEWAAQWPEQIVAALDARDGVVMAEGWHKAGEPVAHIAISYRGSAIAALLYTNIARDGMLTGPDLAGTLAVAAAAAKPALVSGGIGSVADVEAVIAAGHNSPGAISGMIIGRAYYDGKITLHDLARLQELADAD